MLHTQGDAGHHRTEHSKGLYKVLCAIASETGMRAGELYGLEITDIDVAE